MLAQAEERRPYRQSNPIGLTILVVSAVLAAVGVVGATAGTVTRRQVKAIERATPPPPPGGIVGRIVAHVAIDQGGGPAAQTQTDDEIMRTGRDGFTTFFTRDVEREIISRLQAYKNEHQIVNCEPVHGFMPSNLGGLDYLKYFREAERATREILTELYPTGAPWHGDTFAPVWYAQEAEAGGPLVGGVSIWRWWLWRRVNTIAGQEICNWTPVT